MFGHDPRTFPIARALRMSAAVPFMFQPVRLGDHVTGEVLLISDGAMASNFPVRAVSTNHPVLGFRLVDDGSAHRHLRVRGPASLARAVVISGIRARCGLPQPPEGAALSLDIPVREDLDFNLEPDQASALFESGRSAAAAQLERAELIAR